MKSTVLYEGSEHRWIVMGRDPSRREQIVDTNQYAIATQGGSLLVDPGGIEIFPQVVSELVQHVRLDEVKALFSSHQDPDISSSLSMWMDLCPGIKVYTSWMWSGFLSHFCMGRALDFEEIPDEGGSIRIGSAGVGVEAIPAHYCHSSGNFGLWDPRARILFSGDVGAALLPDAEADLFVTDFDAHIQYMEGFHLRWMPANAPLRAFARRARALSAQMICPQHGSIFRGDDVNRFLDWIENLDVEACNPMADAATARATDAPTEDAA